MYRTASLAAASVVLALLLPPEGAMAFERAAAPSSGTFQAQVFVNSVSSSSSCVDPLNFVYLGSLSFGGMSAATLTLRWLETGKNLALTSIQTLSVTAGKGTTTPSGTLAWTVTGVGGNYTESGTWSGTITEIGSHAFVLQLTEKYGSCTEGLNIPLVRIGANQ